MSPRAICAGVVVAAALCWGWPAPPSAAAVLDPSDDAAGARLATSANGRMAVAWSRRGRIHVRLFARSGAPAGRWTLRGPDGRRDASPILVRVDGRGRILLLVTSHDGSEEGDSGGEGCCREVYFAVRAPGRALTPLRRASPAGTHIGEMSTVRGSLERGRFAVTGRSEFPTTQGWVTLGSIDARSRRLVLVDGRVHEAAPSSDGSTTLLMERADGLGLADLPAEGGAPVPRGSTGSVPDFGAAALAPGGGFVLIGDTLEALWLATHDGGDAPPTTVELPPAIWTDFAPLRRGGTLVVTVEAGGRRMVTRVRGGVVEARRRIVGDDEDTATIVPWGRGALLAVDTGDGTFAAMDPGTGQLPRPRRIAPSGTWADTAAAPLPGRRVAVLYEKEGRGLRLVVRKLAG